MEHIETIELTSSQSSITFSSIPQDYDDLKILVSARSTGGDNSYVGMAVNGSSSNQSAIFLYGTGSSVNSNTPPADFAGEATGGDSTANTFGNTEIYISNYTSSSAKSYSADGVEESNNAAEEMSITAGLYNSTSAITSLVFSLQNGDINSGSTFSLYGITAGGDGTVTTA